MISTMRKKLKMKLAVALAFARLRREECLKFNATGNYRAGPSCHHHLRIKVMKMLTMVARPALTHTSTYLSYNILV